MVCATDRHARADLRLGDAEDPDEFVFKMFEGAKSRRIRIEMAQRAAEKVAQLGKCVFGLGDQFDELDEERGQGDALVLRTQSGIRFPQDDLTQRVELAFSASREGNLAIEEKVEASGKFAFRVASSFRHGFQLAMGIREPGQNQARIGELGLSQEDG